jgi:cob(I)alamin adenosyltransferase
VRITRVYTRTGDGGTTRLVGGAEVAKDDARIEAFGTVDELNAVLGLARTENDRSPADAAARETVRALLSRIQNDLFNVGADLATPEADRWPNMHRVGADEVVWLEQSIDALNADLEPLREFILPGGGPVGALLHQARTVCRRAERRVVTLHRLDPEVGDGCLIWLNRLSDLLFVLGRWSARSLGEPEYFWQKPA